MPNFSTFIFDVDGTIAQTNELIFESFRYVAKKYLKKDYSDDDIISLFGPTEDVILKDLMNEMYEDVRKDYFDFYRTHHNQLARAFEGMDETLQLLKSYDINLAIFTGKGAESARITLEQIGFDKYFSYVVSGDDVVDHKPSPEGLLKIVDHFDIDKKDAIMIGDSPHDIEASRDAEVKIASVVWDSYAKEKVISMQPDYLFNTVDELKNFATDSLKGRVDK